jgi:hypothetical protein
MNEISARRRVGAVWPNRETELRQDVPDERRERREEQEASEHGNVTFGACHDNRDSHRTEHLSLPTALLKSVDSTYARRPPIVAS